ncbi:hypothetical protein ACOMHN_017198 [Nucella lapillus]
MGRERTLRTYGHHKHRCVSTDVGDLFRSADENRQIFNTSSSESGLGPSDSVESAETSLVGHRAAKNKALIRLKAKEDEEGKNKNNKRKRQPAEKKAVKLFTSDKDSTSSSDCGTPAQKRATRRPLRDTNNEQVMTKCQPGKRNQPRRQPARKEQSKPAAPSKEQYSSINFSEFDDYSLIISDSPPGKAKAKTEGSHLQLGTSTPCDSTSRRARPSPGINAADISFIPVVFENSALAEDKEKSFSSCYSIASPTFDQGDNVSWSSMASAGCKDHTEESGESSDQKNLERLESSFVSLRVGGRRSRKQEGAKTQTPPPPSVRPNLTDSQLEDPIAAECTDRLKKLHMNLRSKMVDVCHVSVFDNSHSLFGAIVEDEEEEEEDEEEEDEEEQDEEEEDEEEEDEEANEKSLSVRYDLTHSFAEVLTPSKARARSGEELSPLEKVLEQCGQQEPLPFTSALPARILRKCVKIGEGVYGEVFRTMHNGESVALKIIPIEGDFEVNDEPQKIFREILPEIVISNELSRLREGEENSTSNFCTVKSVSLVQGRYPHELLKQWDIYHKKKTSENDRPDVFGDEQLYIMLEFGDGGCDLDACKLTSTAQAVSVLQQVACALAVAEEELRFEHRDLHVGNVLVQPTTEEVVTSTLGGHPFSVPTQGVRVSIIDFTLSRLTKDGCTVFCDLATDDTLFEGQGDYQFEIYRMMKGENENNWEHYHPYTNVMWLHYLCDKLLHHRHFQEKTGRPHRDSIKQLRQACSALLDYSSASHFVLQNSLFDT